jgi:hypothetical protein
MKLLLPALVACADKFRLCSEFQEEGEEVFIASTWLRNVIVEYIPNGQSRKYCRCSPIRIVSVFL